MMSAVPREFRTRAQFADFAVPSHQNMFRQLVFSLGLFLSCASAPLLQAQPVRILTAQLDGLEAPSGDTPPGETQARRLAQCAETFRTASADVLVLGGLPNRAFATRLAATLKPAGYQLALFATLPGGGTNKETSTTILSKRQPFAARSAEWRAAGQVELPGGFAFVGFRSGTNTFCLYVADLPGAGVAAAGSIEARQREVAAQYLAHHLHWLNTTLSNQAAAFAVIGDLAMEPGGARLESAGRMLQQTGFGAWLAPQLPDAQFTGAVSPHSLLLARNVSLLAAPALLSQQTLRQPVCVYELGQVSRITGQPVAAVALKPGGNGSKPAGIVLWVWMGAILGVSVVTLGIWFVARRIRPASEIFRARDASQLVLDVDPDSFPSSGGEAESASQVREGLFQHLRVLLRERVVTWLAAQRGRLLASHDQGTKQVAAIEERLLRVQGQFQEQLQTRDQRILELEREIQAREALIRKLLLARAGHPDLTQPE